MRDLLYVIGRGSKHNDIELRYSLRSIERYCCGYDRIFIVGYRPRFLNDNVVFLDCPDKYASGNKHRNILNCIQFAVDNTDISEDFILQSDDHFYIKPYDFRDTPIYSKGKLFKDLSDYKSGGIGYRRSLHHTRQILDKYGYGHERTCQHCGVWFSKSIFKKIETTLLADAYSSEYGAEPACLVNNVMIGDMGLDIEKRKDVKLRDVKTLNELPDGCFCYSIGDEVFNLGIEKIWQQQYPSKCIYEK